MSKNNTLKIMNIIKEALIEGGNEVGVIETANIQSNTPVDSGTLRRSIAYKVTNNNDTITITIGADGKLVNNKNGSRVEDYAIKVEYKDKSYIRDTLNSDVSNIENIISQKILSKVEGV